MSGGGEDWHRAIAATIARFRWLDVLVNDADINRPGGLKETSLET